MTDAPVGHFHSGDDTTVGPCCCDPATCEHPDESYTCYPTDIAAGHVAADCARCGTPLCTPEQAEAARQWAELYG